MSVAPHISDSRPTVHARAAWFAGVAMVALGAALAAQAKPDDAASGAGSDIDLSQPHPVLDRIRSTGRIVLAHRESSVPFSYYDAGKHPIGYAMDLCKDLAETVRKRLGMKTLEIAYLPVNVPTRLQAIIDGKADLECGTTTNNAERRQKVAFTIPHYITGSRYIVRADSPIAELDQFEDHTLLVTTASTQFKAIDKANRERAMRINLQQVPDNAKAMELIVAKKADGFAMDDVQLYGMISVAAHPKDFKVVGKFLTIEPLAIMLSKDDPVFKKIVDDEMRRLIRSGEAETMYDRWFLQPIPPNNVPMNLPMNYLLRDSWRYPSDIVGN